MSSSDGDGVLDGLTDARHRLKSNLDTGRGLDTELSEVPTKLGLAV